MITFNEGQKDFISAALTLQGKGLVLLGEGGTGKTTCIMEVVKQYVKEGKKVLLTAPTNKAVKQLENVARAANMFNYISTMTIHKALGLGLLPDEENKFPVKMGVSVIPSFDLLVIDEGSMLSNIAVNKFIAPEIALNPDLKVIIMGDDYQLPPVKETESPGLLMFPSIKLTKVERFKEDSGIAAVVTGIRKSIETNKPFNFDESFNVESMQPVKLDQYILDQFNNTDDVDSVRAIAWTNARVDEINEMVREKLYGKNCAKYVVGERVVTGAPIKDVMTDEILLGTDEECIVLSVSLSSIIDRTSGEEYKTYYLTLESIYGEATPITCHVIHEDSKGKYEEALSTVARRAYKDRRLWGRYHDLKELASVVRHCYCITAHRSQGSTYPHVIVDVRNIQRCRDRKMARKLLNVASGRASKRLAIGRTTFTL